MLRHMDMLSGFLMGNVALMRWAVRKDMEGDIAPIAPFA